MQFTNVVLFFEYEMMAELHKPVVLRRLRFYCYVM